jgi:hypothetical protein
MRTDQYTQFLFLLKVRMPSHSFQLWLSDRNDGKRLLSQMEGQTERQHQHEECQVLGQQRPWQEALKGKRTTTELKKRPREHGCGLRGGGVHGGNGVGHLMVIELIKSKSHLGFRSKRSM